MLSQKRCHSDKEQEKEKTTFTDTEQLSLLNDINMYSSWKNITPLARLMFTQPLIYGIIVKR
jgi:hypothetical protein